jgi:RimJ/RimL family protein N-acetyltransferase
MEMDRTMRPAPTDAQVSIERRMDGSIGVTIETERLRVAPVTHADAAEYHQHLFSDPTVMGKFATGEVRDRAYVDGRINAWVERWKSGDPFGGFVIRDRSGQFIGHVVLGHGDDPGHSEIAYLIRADKWGQGYGSEAVRGVVQGLAPLLRAYGYSVENGDFRSIDATARPDNPGSGKILTNLGMDVVSTSEKFGAVREHYRGEVALPNATASWEMLVFGDRTLIRERS